MEPYASVKLVYFSPTGTTRRVLEGIARALPVERIEHLDLTSPDARTRRWDEIRDELVLVGAPVYAGRIPPEAARRLGRISGRNSAAVVVAVYGNRAYEDALLELRDLALRAGFTPIAGAAFIGEHSYSTESTPLAHGRPDAQDIEAAAAFAGQIQAKLQTLDALDAAPQLDVPGDFPYQELGRGPSIAPDTVEELCTLCGACARACPTAAIEVGDDVRTEAEACILCFACVKSCPADARVLRHPRLERTIAWLSRNCADRKEPETHL